ncbi:unnamed protein product [Bursaphelenchus xylophilus]|uniref:(pine wood nematode) hypothetical protein n=1 Tax=Bursaphelenchus xylophilus TaxID=6326 RepID=A0A1I7S5T5_BURXY|nr:unnamed protein product [Bursaphelenchus xylophilus]CAG9125047.1 unnamed protein product [Bursaphelenchus xylophilus]
MSAEVENVAPVNGKGDEKPENKEKQLGTLLAEGKKLLIAGNVDLAIDKLSDAALLGSTVYGELGREMYEVYMSYGRAQLESCNEMATVVNTKVDDEADSTDDEEDGEGEENGEKKEENGEEKKEATEEKKEGEEKKDDEENEEGEEKEGNEEAQAEDTASVKDGEAPVDDALTDMIRSAWDLFELAKKIAQKEVDTQEDQEKKVWIRRLADASVGIGQLMIIDEQYDLALEELNNALTGKKEVLDEFDREIAEVQAEIARVLSLKEEFKLASQSYQDALNVIQKSIENCESKKTEENAKIIEKEINDLEEISRDIQNNINELSDQVALDQKIKDELKKRIFGSEPFQQVEAKEGEEVNDITELVRKRKKQPESEEADEKRAKTE